MNIVTVTESFIESRVSGKPPECRAELLACAISGLTFDKDSNAFKAWQQKWLAPRSPTLGQRIDLGFAAAQKVKPICETCDQFAKFIGDHGPVSCKAIGCATCKNQVSLMFGKCPLGKWDNRQNIGVRGEIVVSNLHGRGLGDYTLLSAVIRDLHLAHPGRFKVHVETWVPELFQHNPNVESVFKEGSRKQVYKIDCGTGTYAGWDGHFIEMFHRKLGEMLRVDIPVTKIGGDIHLSQRELELPRPYPEPYWLLWAGAKMDMTCKKWPHASYQKLVDLLRDKVRFVQVGASGQLHKPLRGVINRVGRTPLRELIRLMYHAQGGVGPVSFGMHLSAAVPGTRPYVVLLGGRETLSFVQYPGHQVLHTFGRLPCCESKGCWKFKAQTLGDNRPDCDRPIRLSGTETVPECMTMIEPEEVAARVLKSL